MDQDKVAVDFRCFPYNYYNQSSNILDARKEQITEPWFHSRAKSPSLLFHNKALRKETIPKTQFCKIVKFPNVRYMYSLLIYTLVNVPRLWQE